jgi:hypothetical protein
MAPTKKSTERRTKYRFEMQRELRYKLTGDGIPSTAGTGRTINLCSAGVAFEAEHEMPPRGFVELSISWPVLLDDSCPMRLIVFGRVLRAAGQTAVCSIDKYEFRTSGRTFQVTSISRTDSMLQRWAQGMRKELLKENVAGA